MILLTDEEITPFVEVLQEEAKVDIDGLLKAQLRKVVDWIEGREGHIICRSTDEVVTITLSVSDWQALLEETQ